MTFTPSRTFNKIYLRKGKSRKEIPRKLYCGVFYDL